MLSFYWKKVTLKQCSRHIPPSEAATSQNMALNNSGQIRWMKFALLAFTSILVLTGVMLVVLGSTINDIYSQFTYFLQMRYFSPSFFLIVIGFTIFAVAGLGLVGAIRESSKMIFMFAAILQIIFALEIGASLTGYVLSGDVRTVLIDSLNSTMTDYNNDPLAKEMVDSLQTKMRCCGIDNATDWNNIMRDPVVPQSCCNSTSTSKHSCPSYYTKGCLPRLGILVQESGLLLATTALSIACIQWVGIILALLYGRLIRYGKEQSEEKRWIMREQFARSYDNFYPEPLPDKK